MHRPSCWQYYPLLIRAWLFSWNLCEAVQAVLSACSLSVTFLQFCRGTSKLYRATQQRKVLDSSAGDGVTQCSVWCFLLPSETRCCETREGNIKSWLTVYSKTSVMYFVKSYRHLTISLHSSHWKELLFLIEFIHEAPFSAVMQAHTMLPPLHGW